MSNPKRCAFRLTTFHEKHELFGKNRYAGDIPPEMVCVNDKRAELILCSTNNDKSITWFVDWED